MKSIAIVLLGGLIFSMLGFSPTLESVNQKFLQENETRGIGDTLLVKLTSNYKGDVLLYFEDEFDNSHSIMPGNNFLDAEAVITDSHWQHQINYYVPDNVKKLTLSLSKGFYLIDAGDMQLNKALNFEVAFREQISPITDKKSFFKEFEFNNAEYFNNPIKREKDIDKRITKKLEFLEQYSKLNNLNRNLVERRRRIIQMEKLNYQLYITDYTKWDKQYLRSLTALKPQFMDSGNINLPIYRKSLRNFIRLLTYLNNNSAKLQIKDYKRTIDFEFQGKTKDFLICNLLLSSLGKDSGIIFNKSQYELVLEDFLATCKTEKYETYIQMATNKQTVSGKTMLLKADNSAVEFESILVKGQATYVDFWASWCGPCRAEMPDSKKLKDEYGKKGINFIYISTDENPAAWERARKQIGIPNTESFLTPKGHNSEIAKMFDVTTIPRYLLFDKNNRLINKNAPRPSSPQIRKMFNEVLKN